MSKAQNQKNVAAKKQGERGAKPAAKGREAGKAQKAVAAPRPGERGPLGGRVGCRTYAIERFLLAAKAPVKVRAIEDALPDVKAVRRHIDTLYAKQLIVRDDAGAYYVSPVVRKRLAGKRPVIVPSMAQAVSGQTAAKLNKNK